MDIFSRWLADAVLFIGRQAQGFWENLILLNFSPGQVVIDILLVSILFYYIFVLLKGTRAVNILFGLIIVGFVFALSKALQLVTLGWLLDRFLTVILVAIPVIFQQELRMALERIGHTKIPTSQKERELTAMINNLVESCDYMGKQKIGALIVLENSVPLKEYVDTGIPLNSKISKELILSIFMNRSPLHDGAVVIRDGLLAAASCVLPHSFKTYNQTLGTRHKAALGLSENTDAKIIVVSEEKGTISFAQNGHLEQNISLSRLQAMLTDFLKPPRHHKKKKP
jgi:diadenylate cyclase